MILDLLNIIATSALAVGAILVARQANQITKRSIRIEADKHVFEWGQRCLNCLSRASSLRLTQDGHITDEDFARTRQALRAELFALKEEGELFFNKASERSDEPALLALYEVTRCLNGSKFRPPAADDYDQVRKPQNDAIRGQTRAFVRSVQEKVGTEWMA